MLRNTKGFVHIGAVIFIFALIGLWFTYRSYQENKLKDNLSFVLNDYKTLIISVVKDPAQRQEIEQLFVKIPNSSVKDIDSYIEQVKNIVGQYRNSADIQQKLEHLRETLHAGKR